MGIIDYQHTAMRTFITTLSSLILAGSASAASGGHQLPLYPESPFDGTPFSWVSNSMIMVWIATLAIVFFCRAATKKMAMVPQGFQNFAEWVIESLYNFFKGILGDHLAKRTFWFFGGTFLLILTVNYLGLFPGVGTMGNTVDGHFKGFLRGGNADLNMTGAMSLSFAALWFYWAFSENGVKGFFAHIFAPKGEFTGIMKVGMIAIFGLVGVLELVSIAVRPLALSFRLFGNIFGGEQTLEQLMGLVSVDALKFLPALPFMFMELLVGFVQALVFTLLSAVFLKLICEHSDHAEGEGHH